MRCGSRNGPCSSGWAPAWFVLCCSKRSSRGRPSCWAPAPWSSPSSLPSSSPRKPAAPLPPPLPRSSPSATSPSQTARRRCPHWPASTSTRRCRAATKRPRPPPELRTLSRCCTTASSEEPWGRSLCSRWAEPLTLCFTVFPLATRPDWVYFSRRKFLPLCRSAGWTFSFRGAPSWPIRIHLWSI